MRYVLLCIASGMVNVALTFRVMEKDPFHANCLPVHIGTLVELNKANGNFLLIKIIIVKTKKFSVTLEIMSHKSWIIEIAVNNIMEFSDKSNS